MSLTACLAIAGLLAFDPAATAKALGRPEARAGALRQVLSLRLPDLERARAERLALLAAAVVADETAHLDDRILAARATALLGGDGVAPLIATSLVRTDSPEQVALAREVAIALRKLEAPAELTPGLDSADPEVRATAAAAGAGAGTLCRLLREDVWPDVRAAAADGLAGQPDHATCLADGLRDAEQSVSLASARAAGGTGRRELVEPLRTLAGDARAPVPSRVEAFVALGRLGDAEPARRALETHLSKGGIVPLAEASVYALTHTGLAAAPLLRRALDSEAPPVRLAAARALATIGDAESIDRLRTLRDGAGLRERAVYEEALQRLGHDPDEADPALDDPE